MLVAKHHDGYALFDLPPAVSRRTSVALPPHRDLLAELFAAAAARQPQLRRAAYFSLPEWFSPAYAPLRLRRLAGRQRHQPLHGRHAALRRLRARGRLRGRRGAAVDAAPGRRRLRDPVVRHRRAQHDGRVRRRLLQTTRPPAAARC